MTELSSSTITKVDKKSLDNLKKDIKQNGATIILYHWNNCGHCRTFMPIWDRLKSMFRNSYNFHDIEFSKMQEAPAVFGKIHSFPTIRMYLTDGKINYEGSRDLNVISNYIKSNIPERKVSSQPKSEIKPKSEVKGKKIVKAKKEVKPKKK